MSETESREMKIKTKIEELFEKKRLDTPCVTADDFTRAIIGEKDE